MLPPPQHVPVQTFTNNICDCIEYAGCVFSLFKKSLELCRRPYVFGFKRRRKNTKFVDLLRVGVGSAFLMVDSSADEGGPAGEVSDDSDCEFEEARSRVGETIPIPVSNEAAK